MSDRYSYLEGTSEMKMKTKGASSFIGWIKHRVKPREDPTQDASSSTGERTRTLCLTETPRECLGGVLE